MLEGGADARRSAMGPQTFYHAMLTMLRLAERWQIRRLVG